MEQLLLTEIWIYPIKSLGGIRMNSAKVLEKGLEFDRRWMLVDENGTFMTQRIHPRMALFKLALNGSQIFVQYRPVEEKSIVHSSITLDTSMAPRGESMRAVIWNDEVRVAEVDPAISEWFSALLELNCRLVAFPETNPRPVDPRYHVNEENVSLADAYPFMIIGERTLNDLNARLKEPVPMNRFRPNFVFSGGTAHAEDSWKEFSIGTNRFMGVKPCSRCKLTTVNQDTAQQGVEPLLTLSEYRRKDNNVLFGQNLVALDYKRVMVGDEITVM